MQTNLKIRWINDACYELKLPNGKGILIDPFIERSQYSCLSREQIEGADYILISHTHFDHVMDVPYFYEKFHSSIYAPLCSGMELARVFDIPGGRMTFCRGGDVFVTEDFKLECYRGHHTDMGNIDCPSNWPENLKKEGLPPEHEMLNRLGSYEYMVYVITLPWNQRILIWGGAAIEDAVAQAVSYKPDISVMQIPREKPEQIGRLYAAAGGRYIFPHHHEYYLEQGETGSRFIADVIESTNKRAPYTEIILPEKGAWYDFSEKPEVHSVQ